MSKTVALLGTLLLVSVVGAMMLLSGCVEPSDPTGKYHSPEEIRELEEQARTPTPVQAPAATPVAAPELTPKPIEIKDSDGDGVPDHEDYAPHRYIGPEEDLNRDGALDASRAVVEYGDGVRDELRLRGLLDGLEKLYSGNIKELEIIRYDTDFDQKDRGTWDKVEIKINGEHFASYKYHPGLDIYGGIGEVVDPERCYGAVDLRID